MKKFHRIRGNFYKYTYRNVSIELICDKLSRYINGRCKYINGYYIDGFQTHRHYGFSTHGYEYKIKSKRFGNYVEYVNNILTLKESLVNNKYIGTQIILNTKHNIYFRIDIKYNNNANDYIEYTQDPNLESWRRAYLHINNNKIYYTNNDDIFTIIIKPDRITFSKMKHLRFNYSY